eukprot:TRINITY_DN5202_c0_g1_i4.p1 TRINITY_DN5202_c0_g1~~TRINITY_DN5202_c0_g1_i4.p1  ORF type:complete len:125 (+),score=40.13 TRINITY_DN5202_c0_g1_i4:140-514(+)
MCIRDRSTGSLYFIELQATQMLIKVNVNSDTHEINVEPNDTIAVVKTKVEEVICVPPQMQRLIHNGAPLSDEATVESSLSLIHISEPTRLLSISYAVFCLKKKKKKMYPNTGCHIDIDNIKMLT